MRTELIKLLESRKVSEREYRSHPALSRSELWRIDESPEKFNWYRRHPSEPTEAMVFGSLVHKMVLEPKDVASEYARLPAFDRRTKAGREDYEQFVADHLDVTCIPSKMWDQALDMSGAAYRNSFVQKILEDGVTEVPFYWTDKEFGTDLKCRVDVLTEIDGRIAIVDLKTTTNAKTSAFNSSIWKYGYHFQAAFYSTGVMQDLRLSYRPDFIIVAQEKTEPYSVNVIKVSSDVMLAGIDKMHELVGIYQVAETTGVWYGYNGFLDEMNETTLPGWVQLGVEEGDGE